MRHRTAYLVGILWRDIQICLLRGARPAFEAWSEQRIRNAVLLTRVWFRLQV